MKSSRLVKLINSARNDNKQWMLQVILAHADQLLIDNLFAKLNIPSHLLRDVANSADLACIPQRFIYLLERITDKEDQEWAVEKGVGALFNRGKTECLIPLVSALCECPLSGNVDNVSIRKAFYLASNCPVEGKPFVECYFDHPAILAQNYSNALYASYKDDGQANELFKWLLDRADRRDLKVVKKHALFFGMKSKFKKAVNQTVGIESRHKLRRPERIAAVEEAAKEYFPNDLVNLIGEFVE